MEDKVWTGDGTSDGTSERVNKRTKKRANTTVVHDFITYKCILFYLDNIILSTHKRYCNQCKPLTRLFFLLYFGLVIALSFSTASWSTWFCGFATWQFPSSLHRKLMHNMFQNETKFLELHCLWPFFAVRFACSYINLIRQRTNVINIFR